MAEEAETHPGAEVERSTETDVRTGQLNEAYGSHLR